MDPLFFPLKSSPSPTAQTGQSLFGVRGQLPTNAVDSITSRGGNIPQTESSVTKSSSAPSTRISILRFIYLCELSSRFPVSINLFSSAAYPACHNRLSGWWNVNRFNDDHRSRRGSMRQTHDGRAASYFSFSNRKTVSPPTIRPRTAGGLIEDAGESGLRAEAELTGGAENLKREEPRRARNFGEYIRSWTESCSFSSTQPM